jgi:hypothetical protein
MVHSECAEKAAKRSESWHLSPPPPQNMAASLSIPARKKPRLEEPPPATTDEAARETASPAASPEISVGLPPPTADNDDAYAVSVTDTHDVLDCSIDRAIKRKTIWTEDEDSKLKGAVETHGSKHWEALAVLVPGRTKTQCYNRWRYALDPSIALTAGSTGKWVADEDRKLKGALETHGGKDWEAIAALVPGRTKQQCSQRWHNTLDPSIALTAGSMGTWTEDEDHKLKYSVKMHGGKDWEAIAALVPGRTKKQCYNRWHDTLVYNIDQANGRTGKWVADEDHKLKGAVETHGGKDWEAIAALLPGRTKKQCNQRWHCVLNLSTNPANGRTGKWAADEDHKLKRAVQAEACGRNARWQGLGSSCRAGSWSNEKAVQSEMA